MSVIIFIIILVILILAHEFGHFIVAKRSGIRVDEFGIGFPPKIFGKKFGETEYSLNWIPFGGFVKIFGEDAEDEALSGSDKERSLTSKPKYIQAAVISAGVFFNILLAWILISFGFMSGLPAPVSMAGNGGTIENAHLTIISVGQGTPAETAGLRPGDHIVALTTNTAVLQDSITPDSVSSFIVENGEEAIAVLYERAGENGTVFVTPEEGILEGRFAIGITMDTIGILTLPPHKALWEGAKTTVGLTQAILFGFVDLIKNSFSNGKAGLAAVTGPIGIIGLVGDASDFGFVYLLGFTAFISINLAIINLIPFPALDGGRLLFILIEAIKGSPINPKVTQGANSIGFLILIVLMLVVTYNDIVKIFF